MNNLKEISIGGIVSREVRANNTIWILLEHGGVPITSILVSPSTGEITLERPTNSGEMHAFLTGLGVVAQGIAASGGNLPDIDILPSSTFSDRFNCLGPLGSVTRMNVELPRNPDTANIIVFPDYTSRIPLETVAYQYYAIVASMYESFRQFNNPVVKVGIPKNVTTHSVLLGGAPFGLRLGVPINRVDTLGLTYPEDAMEIML